MSARTRATVSLALFLAACGRVGYDPLAQSDSGALRDGSTGDARYLDAAPADGAPDGGPGSIVVANLHVIWVTPNTIRWGWDVTGDPADFDRYELVTARDDAHVSMRSGTAIVWTDRENPELGALDQPGLGTVRATTTDELEPGADYFAELTVVDLAGRSSSTAIARARTADIPNSSLVLYADADTAGFSLPGEMVRSTTAPFRGTHAYEWTAACPTPLTSCWENLRREDVDQDVVGVSFATAYVEFAISADRPMVSWYAEWRLIFRPGLDTHYYHVPGITIRADGAYRVYQLPLSKFVRYVSGTPLDATTVGAGLFEFGIGSEWSAGAAIRMDEVSLHW